MPLPPLGAVRVKKIIMIITMITIIIQKWVISRLVYQYLWIIIGSDKLISPFSEMKNLKHPDLSNKRNVL